MLGGYSSSLTSYYCPYKETRIERHTWHFLDYSILELIITSSSAKMPSPKLIDNYLKVIRECLITKSYEKLRGHLKKKE